MGIQGMQDTLKPLTGAEWAASSEMYAELVSEHLHAGTTWLDAGCGSRILEDDLDPLEDWLVEQCGLIVGMDVLLRGHRNVRLLVRGSLYDLPFADGSLDLVTCNMVVEHLEDPARAIVEISRCLRADGAVLINTPNLLNYGVIANAIATRVMPEQWRLRVVRSSDDREPYEVFPVQYRANTLRRLTGLLNSCGLEIHKAFALPQRRPFLRRATKFEHLLMKITPNSRLLVCAHKGVPG